MIRMNRNEPCPCGSGKKYKKCCLHANEERANATLSLSHIMERAHHAILEYSVARWGDDVLLDALQDFKDEGCGLAIDIADPQADEITVFMNWFMFQYNPPNVSESDYDELDQQWAEGQIDFYTPTMAQQALKHHGGTFDAEMKAYVEQELSAPYTFLEIEGHDSELNETRAYDLAANHELSFVSSPVMQLLERNHIIFGKIIKIGESNFLQPMGDAIFKPEAKSDIVPFAAELYAERLKPRIREERVAVSESMLWHYGMLRQ